MNGIMKFWRGLFNARQLQEIDFDIIYARDFSHGTDGHNARIIIAEQARILDRAAGLLDAVNAYRVAHSEREAGAEDTGQLNDTYVAMLVAADALDGDNK